MNDSIRAHAENHNYFTQPNPILAKINFFAPTDWRLFTSTSASQQNDTAILTAIAESRGINQLAILRESESASKIAAAGKKPKVPRATRDVTKLNPLRKRVRGQGSI